MQRWRNSGSHIIRNGFASLKIWKLVQAHKNRTVTLNSTNGEWQTANSSPAGFGNAPPTASGASVNVSLRDVTVYFAFALLDDARHKRRVRAAQLDFTMSVAVCAWCEPSPPPGEIGMISHGICPRHLRFLKARSQGLMSRRRRRRSSSTDDQEPQLPF